MLVPISPVEAQYIAPLPSLTCVDFHARSENDHDL